MDVSKKEDGAVKQKRAEALAQLRIKNSAYCERVDDSIGYIESIDSNCFTDPSDSVLKTYAKRLKKQRKLNKLSLEEVGQQIGASRMAVKKLEDCVNQKINRTYLEAFSLLYQVSPLYLLGKREQTGEYKRHKPVQSIKYIKLGKLPKWIKRGKDYHYKDLSVLNSPTFDIEPDVIQKVQLMIWESYCPDNNSYELNQQLIDTLGTLYFAKFYWLQYIKRFLSSIPALKKSPSAGNNISSLYSEKIGDKWTDFRDAHFGNDQFFENQARLCSLGVRDIEMLDSLLHLMFSTENVKSSVFQLLHEGGYLNAPRRFYKIVKLTDKKC